jgi:hypothetical protein
MATVKPVIPTAKIACDSVHTGEERRTTFARKALCMDITFTFLFEMRKQCGVAIIVHILSVR